jgi:hypothetical protein
MLIFEGEGSRGGSKELPASKQAYTLISREEGGGGGGKEQPPSITSIHCSFLRRAVVAKINPSKTSMYARFHRRREVGEQRRATSLEMSIRCSFSRRVVVAESNHLENEHICSFLQEKGGREGGGGGKEQLPLKTSMYAHFRGRRGEVVLM